MFSVSRIKCVNSKKVLHLYKKCYTMALVQLCLKADNVNDKLLTYNKNEEAVHCLSILSSQDWLGCPPCPK